MPSVPPITITIREHRNIKSRDRTQVADDDLVRLGPAGFVHLELVGNINYLAAVAEDSFFADRLQAEQIAARIRSPQSHLHIRTVVDNATDMVSYLEEMRLALNPPKGSYMEDDLLESFSGFVDAREAVSRVARSHAGDPWFDADKRLPRGSKQEGTVANAVEYGYFVEFDDGLRGLIQKKNCGGVTTTPGDRVQVKVLWVDSVQRKMGLSLLRVVAEDVGDQVDGTFGSQTTSPLS